MFILEMLFLSSINQIEIAHLQSVPSFFSQTLILLLPVVPRGIWSEHFGVRPSREAIIEIAQEAERLGYDSVRLD